MFGECFAFKNKFAKSEITILLVIITIIAVILCYGMTEPWTGWFDFNGAAYSRFAKNFLTFGFVRTKFAPTWDLGNIVPERFNYYLHHPPLLAYIVAASFKLFGFHEWSARLVPIIFSLSAIILFYLIIRALWDRVVAIFSLVFLGFTPVFLYYGRMVNHEPVFLFFYLAIIYLYLKFLEKRRKIYLVGLWLCFVLAYLTAWPAFYLSTILLMHYLIFEYKHIKDKRPIMILGLIPILFVLLYMGYIYLIQGTLGDIVNAFIYRAGPTSNYPFTWREFFSLEIDRIKLLFTKTESFFVLFYSIYYLFLSRNKEEPRKQAVAGIFFILAMTNILLFRGGAWEHDYYLYYFLPFFAIASARGLLCFRDYLSSKKTFPILAACFIIIFLAESFPGFISIRSFRFEIDRKIADKIHSITRPDEEIGINFSISIPTGWYVDRRYTVINDIRDFRKITRERKLSFLILIPGDANADLIRYLNEKYPSFIYKNIVFYNLKQHL